MIRDVFAGAVRIITGCRSRHVGACGGSGPRVYFANHTSNLDAIVVWSSLPRECRRDCRIVAAKDYWGRTALRRWLACRVFRAVLIDRTGVTKSNYPLRNITACLDEGCSVIIFPEGTRGDGDGAAAFRAGLWHIARDRPGVEIVPVWIENLSRVLPKGEVLPVPIAVAVTVGEPVVRGDDEPKQPYLERCRDAMLGLRGDMP